MANPDRNSCSSRADIACRLPGRALITTRSCGSSSVKTVRATCRSRRATRCRCTADPTDFATTKPIRGPASLSPSDRSACTTRSRSTARTPFLTVDPNSADRVIRYGAGSTVSANRADSGSQRPPALTPAARHDRATRARTHPKAKSVHPRASAIVRLEGALALGHGSISLLWHPAYSRIV